MSVELVDLVAALAMGIGLGAITGMPLGVINVAIVDSAIARERDHARGLAVGGALADATHALLAFAGLGRLVTARPEVTRYLAIGAALAIIAFAIAAWRRRRPAPRATSPRDGASEAVSTSAAIATPSMTVASASTSAAGATPSMAGGIVSGIALTLPNPAALAAWVAVAAMIWPAAQVAVAIAIALGVGIGSAVWFLVLGTLVAKVRPDHRALQIVPKVALVAFVGIAIVGVLRVV